VSEVQELLLSPSSPVIQSEADGRV
jgi:hypothetical protein